MDWDAWMYSVREYDERTFADYIDGGYDNVTEEEDGWDDE